MADPVITADDVVRAGACSSGVAAVIQRISKRMAVPAAMPTSALLKLVAPGEREYVRRAAALDGSGDGSGYGDGSGDGSGSGYGDGDGYAYARP